MKIKPLTQFSELITTVLKNQTNLSKSFQSFFIEIIELILTHTERLNFTQLVRCGRSCESRFSQNFKKSFDWLSFYLRMLNSNSKQLLSICKLIVADAYLSRESFVSRVKSLGFNLISHFREDVNLKYLYSGLKTGKRGRPQKFAFNASLTSVNIVRAFARQQGMDLSIGSTQTLLHNAAMVDRFIAMFGKSPNMRLNNTDFKELLFYGVRAAV